MIIGKENNYNFEEYAQPNKVVYFTPYKALVISSIFFVSLLFFKGMAIISLIFILLILLMLRIFHNKKHVLFFDTYMLVIPYDGKSSYRIDYNNITKIEIKKSEISPDIFYICCGNNCINFETYKSKKIRKEINRYRKILDKSLL